MEEYPEPRGYCAQPGFVKNNPLNNAIYLARCIEVYPEWAECLTEANDYLETVLPGYNIAQIKAKFGGLRFYWDAPEGADDEVVTVAREVIYRIEAKASDLQ